MNISIIQPVILCGGSGTRLWPLSTPKIPKQFISLGEKGTLLEETLRRVSLVTKESEKKGFQTYEPVLIMHKNHKLPPELICYNNNVVCEDYANDTAVAVAKAAIEIKNRYENENVVLLVLPADHYIENVDAFVADIVDGIIQVTHDNIVLFGIDPISPETKYGYIVPASTGVWFKEKPDVNTAVELIKQKALWNSGIFAANINLVLKCLHNSSHNIIDWVNNPRDGKAASFDVAVLQEHSDIYAHHCYNWLWSDVGTWESFTAIPEVKAEINKSSASVVISRCVDVDVLNRGSGNVVVIGCKDLLIIRNGDDLLIMPNIGEFNNQLKEIATHIGNKS